MRKKEILKQIIELVTEMAKDNPYAPVTAEPMPEKAEMLTIKECTEVIYGLSEHTIRNLVMQGKVKSIRAGEGKRGKILISKDSLLDYFRKK